MPGLDYEVHESVREKTGAVYGCWNRMEFSDGYYAPNRQYSGYGSGKYIMVQNFIPHVMSRECRYDKSLSDRKCAGCSRTGSGEAYAAEIMRKGT